MEKIRPFKSIIGDDEPYNTIHYRDVPDGFRFDNITFDNEEYPEITLIWDKVKDYLNKYYSNWEINANTFVDFLDGLNLSFFGSAGVIEKRLNAVSLISPTGGSKITRSKTGATTENGTNTRNREYNESSDSTVNGSSENIVLAFDSSNEDPSGKTKDNQTTENTGGGSEDETVTNARTGSDTENETIITDLDSLTYYERISQLYPNVIDDFVKLFKENFTLSEVLVW